MYRIIKAIYWIIKFKKEKRDFELAAEFYKKYIPEGEQQDKNVGASMMSAEQAQEKYLASVNVLFNK